MRKLIVEIKASRHEVDLDDYYDEDEEINPDELFDYHIYPILINPDYTSEVVES